MELIFAMVLAGLVALPLSASAQAGEESTTVQPSAEEPAPSAEPAPEEPSLQLKLDDAGVDVVPPPPRTPDGYTLEEMELRVKRAKIGLGVSVPFIWLASLAVLAASPVCFGEPCPEPSPGLAATFAVMSVGGLGGTIASGILLRRRKRDRDSLRQAHYGTPRRVQWDPAQSRLVF
jgi:hypothetical protein